MASGIYGVKIIPSGIEQVFKSGGMRSALESVVAPIAASANANFGLRAGDRVPMKLKNGTVQDVKFDGVPRIPPYGHHVDLGDHTYIGKVVCKTALGAYDNSINNTIMKSR
jgi:hypothetical protein